MHPNTTCNLLRLARGLFIMLGLPWLALSVEVTRFAASSEHVRCQTDWHVKLKSFSACSTTQQELYFPPAT